MNGNIAINYFRYNSQRYPQSFGTGPLFQVHRALLKHCLKQEQVSCTCCPHHPEPGTRQPCRHASTSNPSRRDGRRPPPPLRRPQRRPPTSPRGIPVIKNNLRGHDGKSIPPLIAIRLSPPNLRPTAIKDELLGFVRTP